MSSLQCKRSEFSIVYIQQVFHILHVAICTLSRYRFLRLDVVSRSRALHFTHNELSTLYVLNTVSSRHCVHTMSSHHCTHSDFSTFYIHSSFYIVHSVRYSHTFCIQWVLCRIHTFCIHFLDTMISLQSNLLRNLYILQIAKWILHVLHSVGSLHCTCTKFPTSCILASFLHSADSMFCSVKMQ